MIFSAGKDGSLVFYKLIKKSEEGKNDIGMMISFPFKDILTNKQDLEGITKQIDSLT